MFAHLSSSKYKIFIRQLNKEAKNSIFTSFQKIISKQAVEIAFNQDYHQYKKNEKTEERNPYYALLFKLNTYQILSDEIKFLFLYIIKLVKSQEKFANNSIKFFSSK